MIDVQDVVEIYDPERYISAGDELRLDLPVSALKLKSGAETVQVWFVPGTGSFEEVLGYARTDNASRTDIYNQKVIWKAPGDWKEMGAFGNFCRGRKWLILMEDTNGQARMAGDIKQGMVMGYRFNSVDRTHELSFEAMVLHPAYYLQGISEPMFLGTTSGFSEGFSFGFRS